MLGRFYAINTRHTNVEEAKLRAELFAYPDRLKTRGNVSDNLMLAIFFNHSSQTVSS
jgi:hypothetical protein